MEKPSAPSGISWSQFKPETIEYGSEVPDTTDTRAANNFFHDNFNHNM
jgi:hypothetical protein